MITSRFDPLGEGAYGVVQAVNELVTSGGWRVVGFALEKEPILRHAI